MDVFNKAALNDLLILSEHGENSGNDFSGEDTLTRKLLLAKVLIDRWNNVMTDIFFHESHKTQVLGELSDRITFSYDGDPSIWGATIHFVDNMPVDKALAVSMTNDGEIFGDVPSRAVSSFTL